MSLKHPKGPATARLGDLIFTLEGGKIPRHELPSAGVPPDIAYQIVHDELMLDGNARLNLATFVTTWMEPQANALMAECFDKNMIDKDEYPQTAELELRCEKVWWMAMRYLVESVPVQRVVRAPHAERGSARPLKAELRPCCTSPTPLVGCSRSPAPSLSSKLGITPA